MDAPDPAAPPSPAETAAAEVEQSLPGSHSCRHQLQPGARISILANLKHKCSTRVQAYRVSATVDRILSAPYQCAVDTRRHPFALSTWFIDLAVRDVEAAGAAATEYEPLDPSRVVLRLDEPNSRNRWKGYWWLLQPADLAAAAAAALREEQQVHVAAALPVAEAAAAAGRGHGEVGAVATGAAEVSEQQQQHQETVEVLQESFHTTPSSPPPLSQLQQQQPQVPGLDAAELDKAVPAVSSASDEQRELEHVPTQQQQQQQQWQQQQQQRDLLTVEQAEVCILKQQQQQQQQQQRQQSPGQHSTCGSESQVSAAAAVDDSEVLQSPSLAVLDASTAAAAAAATTAATAVAADASTAAAATTSATAVAADASTAAATINAATAVAEQIAPPAVDGPLTPALTATQPSAAAAAAALNDEHALSGATTTVAAAAPATASRPKQKKSKKRGQQQQEQQQQGQPYVSRRSRAFKKDAAADLQPRKKKRRITTEKYVIERQRLAKIQEQLLVESRLRDRKRQRWQQQQQHDGDGSDSEWEGLAAAMAASMQDAAAAAAAAKQEPQQQQQQQVAAAGVPEWLSTWKQDAKRAKLGLPTQQQQQQLHKLPAGHTLLTPGVGRNHQSAAAAAAAAVKRATGHYKQKGICLTQPLKPSQPQQQQQQVVRKHNSKSNDSGFKVGAARFRLHTDAKGGAGLAAQYRGVYWNFGKFRPQVHVKCGVVRVGSWDTVESAARAYDLAALAFAVEAKKDAKAINYPLQDYQGVQLPEVAKLPDHLKTDPRYLGHLMREWLLETVPRLFPTAAAAAASSSNAAGKSVPWTPASKDLESVIGSPIVMTYVTYQPSIQAIRVQQGYRKKLEKQRHRQQQVRQVREASGKAAATAAARAAAISNTKKQQRVEVVKLDISNTGAVRQGRPPRPLPKWGCRQVRSNHWVGSSDASKLAAAAAAGLAALAAAGVRPSATPRQVFAAQAAAAAAARRRRGAAAAAAMMTLSTAAAAGDIVESGLPAKQTLNVLPPWLLAAAAAATAAGGSSSSSSQKVSPQRATAAAVAAAYAKAQKRAAAATTPKTPLPKPAAAAAAAANAERTMYMQQVFGTMGAVIEQLTQHTSVVGSSLSQLQDSLSVGPPASSAAAAAAEGSAAEATGSSSSSNCMTPAARHVLQQYLQGHSGVEFHLVMMTKIITPHLTPSAAAPGQQQQQQQHSTDILQLGEKLLKLHTQLQQQLQGLVEMIGPLSKAVLEAVSEAPPLSDAAAAAEVVARADWVAGLRSSLTAMRDNLLAANRLLGLK